MAQSLSLEDVLRAIVQGTAECENVALVRIWLIRSGDICSTCRFRPECPDQTRCLHLVASAGNPASAGAQCFRLDGAYCRFPLGVRKIGRVGQTGEPLLIPDLRGDEDWVGDRKWLRREGIKTFAAQPLAFRGEVLGVLALFDRAVLGQEEFAWLRVLADHAAVSIANARAFEQIEQLRARLEKENDYLRLEVATALGFGDVVGQSPGLQKVLEQIRLVAPTDASVLVTGESGTGKELVARAIHEKSSRRDKALIKLNCGAVPESLFDSEFFGHVKGAFTGAIQDRPGRFELADGGTLFLDEIGEVPLGMQAKLLRVLQEQELERIGDTRTRRVNVRIVAATNRDLKREVAAGRFRQDLYYRLSVFPIEVPPLRERREDIAPLALHFVRQTAQRMHRPVPRLSQAAARRLVAHDWPGNVRELQNAVERAVILSEGGPLRFELPEPGEAQAGHAGGGHVSEIDPAGILTRGEHKRRERESIAAALKQTRGKIFGPEGAAALLQMKPTTLASRIKALGLKRR